MNNIRNSIQVVGRLGKDVELKTFESGNKLCRLTIATHDYYRNKEGELVEDTQWHSASAWGRMAELMSTSLSKGSEVILKGKLVYNHYEDSTGRKRSYPEIKVSEFRPIAARQKAPLPF